MPNDKDYMLKTRDKIVRTIINKYTDIPDILQGRKIWHKYGDGTIEVRCKYPDGTISEWKYENNKLIWHKYRDILGEVR